MSPANDGAPAGAWEVRGTWYRLHGRAASQVALLDDTGDRRWAELRMLAAVDRVDVRDETLAVDGPVVEAMGDGSTRLTWALRSTAWDAVRVVILARPDRLAVHAEVDGAGRLGDATLLGGRLVTPRANGSVMSGAWFESMVSGGPADPGRIVRHATESADIGVASGSEPGRGAWFFTPGPFVYAVSRSAAGDPLVPPPGRWLGLGLRVGRGDAGFTSFGYRALDRGFAFTLDYDGRTRVDGTWRSPAVVLREAADPYVAIADWREDLEESGAVETPELRPVPDWWRQPMFCGWGAQAALAHEARLPMSAAPGNATQAAYDGFLAELETRGIRPGTIVVDDKWQRAYGTNEPDAVKWPDLRGWIARRHDAGRRVLLWVKAWDPEGLPDEACILTASGARLAVDPESTAGEAALRTATRRILDPADMDADGIKLDFTARTPTGRAITRDGTSWGVDLLARLLDIIADEARATKPDALVIGHAPNPLTAPALGMLRLNDALRLDDPRPLADLVAQMRHRAAIVRAACPGVPIDTDDWCAPDRAGWRAYAEAKVELGVPALYYTTRLDLSGEPLDDDDAALIRRTWAAYREREGLAEPSTG
jgi:hypothetical protein